MEDPDRAPALGRVKGARHIICVDTVPPPPGMPINAELPAVNGEIPLPDWSVFDDGDLTDLTEELRARFQETAVPQPARVAGDPQGCRTQSVSLFPQPLSVASSPAIN